MKTAHSSFPRGRIVNKNLAVSICAAVAGLFISPASAGPMDLSRIPCDFPWETFTTESNTIGMLFDDNSADVNPRFLDITNVQAGNFTVEMKFFMKTYRGFDQNSSIGVQIWEGLERFGKDKSKKGHFLVLFTSDGNLDVQRWNGSYYATMKHKSRFSLAPQKPQTLKVDASKAGSIKVYINNKLQMSVRVRKLKVNAETPVRICAFPGTWMEITSFEVK